MSENKSASSELKDKLFMKRKNGFLRMSDEEIKSCDNFSENYKCFLNSAKTEREAVITSVELLEKKALNLTLSVWN